MNFCFKLLQELFMEPLRSYIKHSKECFIQFPNLQNKAVPRFLKPSSHCLESGWNNSSCLIITVCWPQGYVSQDDQQQAERWKKKAASPLKMGYSLYTVCVFFLQLEFMRNSQADKKCLPFTHKIKKFQLENQLAHFIPFGQFQKLQATSWSDACL